MVDRAGEQRYGREINSPFAQFYAAKRRHDVNMALARRRQHALGLTSPVGGANTLSDVGFNAASLGFGILDPILRAADSFVSADRGLIPQEDMIGEAFNTAGVATAGASTIPVKGPALRSNNLSGLLADDTPRVTTEPEFRPETYYHGTRADIDAFDSNLVDLGVHVGTKGQANERLNDLVKKESPVYSGGIFGAFDLPEGHASRTPDSAFVTGEGSAEGAQIMPLRVRADYPLRMPDAGEWNRAEVVMYHLEKMMGPDGDPRLREAFEDFDFDELETVRDQFFDNDDWKASPENREFLDEIRERIQDAGYDSIVYRNVVESSRDEGIQDSMIVLDPRNIRSVNAEFDPAFEGSSNLLLANRSRAAGALGVSVKPPTKEELDPLGYQKTKMRKSLFNTEVDEVDLGENLLRIPRSWEEMENRLILPFYGDRTSRGMLVRGVDDMVFDTPVYTEGGVDFMRGPAAQADRAIWASNSNIIKRIADEAEAARKAAAGEPVFGMTGSMAPDANDFAVHTGSVMAEMVKKSKINRQTASAFNDAMRVVDETFPGIRSPKLREWVDNTTSPKRKMFIRLMDSAPMQAGGMPSPAQARYAATDATQRNMGSGQFGMGVAQLDELSPILRINPEGNRPGQSFPHRTYNTQITGDYFGSLPPVPQGLLFKDVYDRMEGGVTKKGQPYNEAHKTHAIKTIMPVQRLRPEIIEGILNYLQRTGN
jgi:hypothetical protein